MASCVVQQQCLALGTARVAARDRKKNRNEQDVTSWKSKGFWRISRLEVAVEKDPGKDCYSLSEGLLEAIAATLGCQPSYLPHSAFSVVRKSFDARKDPRFVYTVDVDVAKLLDEQPKSGTLLSKLKYKPGKLEFLEHGRITTDLVEKVGSLVHAQQTYVSEEGMKLRSGNPRKAKGKVVVVGSGPAGLFASLVLAEMSVEVVLIERGYPVEKRGGHIGSLMARRVLLPDSNFCFGEGGAGTWSDGKLTTRIGKNSDKVQAVLATLVRFGASPKILIEGKPHIGTDKLVLILRSLRAHLQALGVHFMFGTRMDDVIVHNGRAVGVQLVNSEESTKANLDSDAVVLAVGHSARDVYSILASHNVLLSPKDFAVGLRVEHPQELINEMQYRKWATEVRKGRGKVPVADYKLAATISSEEPFRGCYSFCMCPGGQIVPTSTDPLHLCINGMSFSNRASKWANAALVVNVSSKDMVSFQQEHGPLVGVAFQKALEQEASFRGGGDFVVPVQTVPDFLEGKLSGTPLPSSSYRLGVQASRLDDLLPPHLTDVLKEALQDFNDQLHGFIDKRALLHGVETRTSSPVKVVRDDETYESLSMPGLYPIGEGAGYAGGIVSAAVDGMEAGLVIGRQLLV